MTLRVSEVYSSVQGEGDRVGLPTVFVRFAGCNMRCPGWPCDTQFAIDPEIWRYESTKETPEALAARVKRLGIRNICWTGGEPFLQKNEELYKLLCQLAGDGRTQEVFTNGSFPFPWWAIQNMHFTMDWKLQGSGEAATSLETRHHNALKLKRSDSIKFVVTSHSDMVEALGIWEGIKDATLCHWYIGAAWGKISDQEIIDFMLQEKLPWRLNVQVHKHIWDPTLRGV